MTMKGKTIGSLLAMAKSDSPDAYKAWKEANVKHFLMKSLVDPKPNEWDVAQVVLKMYKERFVCVDAKRDTWYEFKDHRWQLVDDNIKLKELLATAVNEEYVKLHFELAKEAMTADETGRAKLNVQMKKCMEIQSLLKTCAFQDKVIKMCKVIFHDGTFLKKMDENPLVFACENGVLDLDLKIFRDGRTDDYCTFTCGLEFHHYDDDDDEVKDLKEYFEKVLVSPKRREYFLDIVAMCLEGGNLNKTVIVGTGDGNNAKSVTFALLMLVFGEYAMKFPRELLIEGRGNSSGGARPELARVRGKRWASTQEIAKTETINIGVLKELTGNDSFYSRGLYEKGTEIKPMFTLMIQCNEPPKVPGHDGATWDRIKVVEFESKFVKPSDLDRWPVPKTTTEQYAAKRFHANLDFGRKLPGFAPVLLWMLFQRYKLCKLNGIAEPPEVKMATNMYRAMNDVYLQFIQEKIEMVEYPADTPEESRSFLKLINLHEEFSTWYQDNHSSYAKEKFNKLTLEHEFNKRFGASTKKNKLVGWYGYKIVEEEMDNDHKELQDLLLKKTTATKEAAKTVAKTIAAKEIKKKAPVEEKKVPAKKAAEDKAAPAKKVIKKKTTLIDVVIPTPKKEVASKRPTKKLITRPKVSAVGA